MDPDLEGVQFHCAQVAKDFVRVASTLDHEKELCIDFKVENMQMVWLSLEDVDRLIDHLLAIRGGPLSKLAVAASKKDKA